ncbi:MAPEG family protein [Chromobacterium piscinae]|uniref:MAPEG family protein n=1 Tax=Chromobacterium piscinae TaxID=686831 RepID=A0ABV0H7C1_9NEIS|nr:MAPEG family protein [Chromobacterium piscinae]MBX9298502.1 MAPEG family protein [Chromobacterium vaccinii]MBX9347916.1 MAPEG family protein [Chromobacterium vaccinii]MBX9357995.1 MAPEG family protein [Chromobacterium vaccinii]MCD5328181.1 MAPEG family protein [Chromobacterium piscinae]
MPFVLWSLLLAAMLPLTWAGVAKAGVRYDNHRPREWAAQLAGYRQRANWAQQNAWEALPTYLAAVTAAWLMKVPVAEMNAAAAVFALARVTHGLLYVADKAALRSLAWLIGLLAVLYLFLRAGGVIAL